eukprot:tig00020850_g14675.t1
MPPALPASIVADSSAAPSPRPTKPPVRVLVTGAAGQIAYSLLPSIARGDMLGPDQPVILHLLDVPAAQDALAGVCMELQDLAYPLLAGLVPTSDLAVAFRDIDYALMLGAMPRKDGMERKDLLKANAGIFKEQGAALNAHAKRTVKVVVVGNPANTNALVMRRCAPDVPSENFSALTRLDHNRAVAQLAARIGVSPGDVHGVCIWGNHSSTQYPDVSSAVATDPATGRPAPVLSLADPEWLRGGFMSTVQGRGGAVLKARKLSSAASAAKAVVDHVRSWALGTDGEVVSMAVLTDGTGPAAGYGAPAGVVFSFPVRCAGGRFEVVPGLELDEFSRAKIAATSQELLEERADAFAHLGLPL